MNKLVKRSPRNFRSFPSIFDELFTSDNWNVAPTNFRSTVPSVNVKENDDEFQLEIAVPGLDKKDIKIQLEDNVLTISSEKESKTEESTDKFTRKEFSYTSFKRSFNMPDSIDESAIEATQKNGVLNIVLPKKEEAKPQAPKAINIK